MPTSRCSYGSIPRVFASGTATSPTRTCGSSADSGRLLDLTTAPLRFGLPDVMTSEGRAVVRDLLVRRLRIGGLLRHPLRLARLTQLLSVADAGTTA